MQEKSHSLDQGLAPTFFSLINDIHALKKKKKNTLGMLQLQGQEPGFNSQKPILFKINKLCALHFNSQETPPIYELASLLNKKGAVAPRCTALCKKIKPKNTKAQSTWIEFQSWPDGFTTLHYWHGFLLYNFITHCR